MPVKLPLYSSSRGPHNVVYYRFVLEVRATPRGAWHSLPCVIDTGTDFTIVPKSLLPPGSTVPPLPARDQLPKITPDYLGSLFFRFPDVLWQPRQTPNLEFRCEECRVTAGHVHHVRLALRDIFPHFTMSVGASRELLLSLLPIHAGFPITAP